MLLSQQRITPKIRDLVGFKLKKDYLGKYIPLPYKYWVGSGREALRQILSSIEGRRVGLPAYTCHVVLDAVKSAGAKPMFYDSGVVAELNEIKKMIGKVDALIVSYNFGFIPEIDLIADLCKKHQVILIEDCAQALGAKYGGKLAGSFGDYAFYSFGISKNIGFCGGLIASKEKMDLGKKSKKKLKKISPYPASKLFGVVTKVIISPLFFHPRIYPFTKTLLQEKLHQKQETLAYTCPPLAKKVIVNQLWRYSKILNLRRSNAGYCAKELKGVLNFVEDTRKSPVNEDFSDSPSSKRMLLPLRLEGVHSAGLYFVIKANNPGLLKRRLLKEGVELGEMYTFQALAKGNFEVDKALKAQKAQKEVLTFALYRDFKEIKYIVRKIKKVCQDGSC